MNTATILIERVNPRTSAVTALVHELDAYLGSLYPAESNHLTDIETLAKPNVRFFAVQVDGDYLGCGAILLQPDGYAEVKRIFVSPRARGLGLARRIIAQLETAVREAGLGLMRLETGTLQPEALVLFAASGFAACGPFGDYPPDDPYSVFMEKRL